MEGKMIIRMITAVVLLSILLSSLGLHVNASPSDSPVGPDGRVPACNTYVLIHGVGQASWAWYRIEAMLQDSGFNTVALDMTGHGKNKMTADNVTTISLYTKPLTDYLASIDKKVILVAHGMGGVPVSYAMEAYPEKIAKAIFLSAVMPLEGERVLDVLAPTLPSLANTCFILHYSDPNDPKPTSVRINVTNARNFFYNRSPEQDIILAETLLEDTPWSVFYDNMKLTDDNYGSINRYYIKTGMDRIFPLEIQQRFITSNPPKQSYYLKNGDHSSFFSETPYLFKLLKEISYLVD